MKKFSDEAIDKILVQNPPIYANGKYYTEMAKKFKIDKRDVKNRCIKLKLIEVRGKKTPKKEEEN